MQPIVLTGIWYDVSNHLKELLLRAFPGSTLRDDWEDEIGGSVSWGKFVVSISSSAHINRLIITQNGCPRCGLKITTKPGETQLETLEDLALPDEKTIERIKKVIINVGE